MHTSYSSNKHDETFDRLVRQEDLILEVTNRLTEALEAAGVTKAELAKRIGRSPGFVSQVFGGGRNLTLRTISDIAAALSLRPTLQLAALPEKRIDEHIVDRGERHSSRIVGFTDGPGVLRDRLPTPASGSPRG